MEDFIFLVILTFCALAVLMRIEDPEWQGDRNITRLAKDSLKRERHPQPKRGYRYVYAGYPIRRR